MTGTKKAGGGQVVEVHTTTVHFETVTVKRRREHPPVQSPDMASKSVVPYHGVPLLHRIRVTFARYELPVAALIVGACLFVQGDDRDPGRPARRGRLEFGGTTISAGQT